MRAGVSILPLPIFELDAEMTVYRQLADFFDNHPDTPACARFRADLKPVTNAGRYVVHLLELLEPRVARLV